MSTPEEGLTAMPFGKSKRDWVVLYRVVVTVCSLVAAGGIAIAVYAGSSYVERTAQGAVLSAIEPMQRERAETLKDYATWRTQKDVIDVRLTTLLEAQAEMAKRQQFQLDRQQNLLEQISQRK